VGGATLQEGLKGQPDRASSVSRLIPLWKSVKSTESLQKIGDKAVKIGILLSQFLDLPNRVDDR